MNESMLEKAAQITKSCEWAYFGVIDENNYPSVSTVWPVMSEGVLEVYFSTSINSNKARRLLKNNKASLCYCDNESNITLVGEAEILNDQDTKSRLWQDDLIHHYPLGKTDPDYCIIKFSTNRVSLVIVDESAEFEVNYPRT